MRKFLFLFLLLILGTMTLSNAVFAADRFTNNGDGTVTDTQTGLMWADKDNGYNVNWYAAKTYCDGFSAGGKSGWRLPTLNELEQLYGSGAYGKAIKRVKSFLWASDEKNDRAGCFRFTSNTREFIIKNYNGDRLGVLPVRNK